MHSVENMNAHTEAVMIGNSVEPVNHMAIDREPVPNLQPVSQHFCSLTRCTVQRITYSNNIFRSIPKLVHRLPDDLKKIVALEFGITETSVKICSRCYRRMHKVCASLLRHRDTYKETASCVDSTTEKPPKAHSSHPEKRNNRNHVGPYACGWCKFRSAYSSTVVKHHYKTHHRREPDVVRLKTPSPKYKSPSGMGFHCDVCNFTGKFRHQLHLHNDSCHNDSVNRDGITDCESDDGHSPVYPYLYYNMPIPNNYFQMQQKYRLKDVKICCEDIFRCGMERLVTRINKQGIRKLCVDSLAEDQFVAMATRYRDHVSYCDMRLHEYVPVDLENLEQKDIETIVRN